MGRGILTRCISVLFVCALLSLAQDRLTGARLPDETAGLDKIVPALASAFDHADIVALSEFHQSIRDSELRIALVRNPEFRKKARFVVVEFASTAEQLVLDRYTSGADVSAAELHRVWRSTTQTGGVWESPVYADFFAAVRNVNKGLPSDERIRVLAGDPPAGSRIDRDDSAVSVLEKQVLQHHGKALLVYGSGHLQHTGGITWKLEHAHSRLRVFVVDTAAAGDPYFRDVQKFESLLKSRMRPVLVPVSRPPFSDVGYGGLALGEAADAFVYWGSGSSMEAGPAPPTPPGRGR